LYLANSLVTAASEPALYRLLTFHVPKTMSLFRCRSRSVLWRKERNISFCHWQQNIFFLFSKTSQPARGPIPPLLNGHRK